MSTTVEAGPGDTRRELAWRPALAIGALVVLVLLLVADRYGFHRDELYFVVAGRHPDWGYIDQPPFTPLVSAGAVELFGLSPVAVRILPALAAAVVVFLAAAIVREFGGGRRAQLLGSVVVGLSWILGLGHLGSTTTYDALAWTVIGWLVVRILNSGDPRQWLLVGAAAGVGLQNKHLVLLLAGGLLIGTAAARRWELLRSGWLWGGIGLALVIWLPNLLWQASNGFPQVEMGGVVADRSSLADTLLVIPFQVVLAGPILSPVLVAGVWWLLRTPAGRAWRPVGWAYLAILVTTILSRGQFYYPAGLFPVLLAAGVLPWDAWLGRGHRRLRAGAAAAAAALSGATMALVLLPVLPADALAASPIPDLNPESVEQIGWPELVNAVTEVVDDLPPADRGRAVILTLNYGEAGAVWLLGDPDLPPVYSGHNSFAEWGPPDDARDLVVLVGHWEPDQTGRFGSCEHRATVDNQADAGNEEQGAGVWVCPELPSRWSAIWDDIRRLG